MTTKEWKSKVAGLGCVLCQHLGLGPSPACLHHAREGQGMSQRASDWLVIPLCHHHHQGQDGIHSAKFYTKFRLDEMDLLAMTIEAAAQT